MTPTTLSLLNAIGKELLEAHKKGDNKDFLKAYAESKWQLTRFDSGSYWIDQL
jgi:hypothetical protein